MDLAPTLFSTGWAAGVNAYATIALLNLLGRAGVGEVPDALEGNVVLAVAVTMYAIEFVTDKVPYVDNVWDAIHTVVRPAVASATGAAFGSEEELRGRVETIKGRTVALRNRAMDALVALIADIKAAKAAGATGPPPAAAQCGPARPDPGPNCRAGGPQFVDRPL